MARITIVRIPPRSYFTIIALIIVSVYGLWLSERVELQLVILCFLLVLTGLPHGAIDPAIAKHAGLWRGVVGLLKFSLCYLTLSVALVGVWFILPELYIVSMLILSIWHFSGDWIGYFSRFSSLAISASVITMPSLFHPSEVLVIFSVLAPVSSQIFVDGMVILSKMSLLAMSIVFLKGGRPPFSVLAELIVLLIAAFVLPPIAYFSVYFCLLHSALHLHRSLEQLGTINTLKYAVPFTALSCLFGISLYFSLPDIEFSFHLIQVVFVGLFALTVPHMLLTGILNTGLHRNLR